MAPRSLSAAASTGRCGCGGWPTAPRWGSRCAAAAAWTRPDGGPVIISGGHDRMVRVWRLPEGSPAGEPLRGHHGPVNAVTAAAPPDGTPVIISGGSFGDPTVRVWRLVGGTPVG